MCLSVEITWNVFCTWSISGTAQLQSSKNISHFQVLVIYLFATLPIKLKLGLQIGGRLLKAMHLEQSNYLANQNQGAVNQYDLTVFIILFQGSSRAMEDVDFSGSWQSSSGSIIGYDCCTSSKISRQGHILGTSGDALGL